MRNHPASFDRLEPRRLLAVLPPAFDPGFAGDGRLEFLTAPPGLPGANAAEFHRVFATDDGGAILFGYAGVIDNGPYDLPGGAPPYEPISQPDLNPSDNAAPFILKLTADGRVDTSFGGGDGIVDTGEADRLLLYSDFSELHRTADGRFLTNNDGLVVAFDADFAFDPDFAAINVAGKNWDANSLGEVATFEVVQNQIIGDSRMVTFELTRHDAAGRVDASNAFTDEYAVPFSGSGATPPGFYLYGFGDFGLADDGTVRLIDVTGTSTTNAPLSGFTAAVRLFRNDLASQGFPSGLQRAVIGFVPSTELPLTTQSIFFDSGHVAAYALDYDADPTAGSFVQPGGLVSPLPSMVNGEGDPIRGADDPELLGVFFDGGDTIIVNNYNRDSTDRGRLIPPGPVIRDGNLTSTAVTRVTGASSSGASLLIDSPLQPARANDVARLASGDLILAGYVDLAELGFDSFGEPDTVEAINARGAAWRVEPAPAFTSAVIDFNDFASRSYSDGLRTDLGFVFDDVSPFRSVFVYGPAEGYADPVLHPDNYGRTIFLEQADGSAFTLESFDYAASRYGEAGDFTVRGTRADGTAVAPRSVSFDSSKALSTLDLGGDFADVTRVEISWAGGVNEVYGAVDNFAVSLGDTPPPPPPPPAGRGIQFEDASGSFYKYESGDFNVFARTPDGTGRGTLTVRAADTGNAVQPDVVDGYVRITRDGDRPFDLEGFDYQALVPSSGDAVVEGIFADGRVERVEIDYADDTFETLTVNWTDLVRVNIIAAGGDSPFAPVIDNLVVEPADPPTGAGITFDDAAVGDSFYKYESGDANVFARDDGGLGRGELDLVDFGVGNGTSVRIDGDERVRITRDRDRPFDLRSIDLGQPLIGQGSAFVSIVYADGTTEVRILSVRNDGRLGRQALDIADAVRVDVFTTDGSPLVVDNVDLVRADDPPPFSGLDFEGVATGRYDRLPGVEAFGGEPVFDGTGGTDTDVVVLGPADGYASNVVTTANYGERLTFSRPGGGTFDAVSLDLAAGRFGEAGDAVITGVGSLGSVFTRTVSFSSKALTTVDLGFPTLVLLTVDFRGGVNDVYGAVDNVRFA